MTTRTDPAFTVRQDRQLIRPNAHSKRFVLGRDRRAARDRRARAARRSTSRSSSTGRARCPARSCTSPRRRSRRRIGRLEPDDRFSVVVYDDVVDVVIESTPAVGRGPPRRHRPAARRSRPAAARTSREGWLRGCEQVAAHLAGTGRQPLPAPDRRPRQRRHHRRRTSWPRHAAELRARGVSTSTFGVGNDFDERLLQDARRRRRRPLLLHRRRAADPRRHHVRGRRDARGRRPRRRARGDRPRRHPDRADQPVRGRRPAAAGRSSRIGDLVSEQVVEVVLRLSFPYGDLGRETGAIVALTDRDGVFARAGPAETEPAG